MGFCGWEDRDRVVGVVSTGGARLSLVRAVPVWGWLVGIVALSTAIRYVFTRQAVAPWIMVDELIYSELAKSFAASGHFLVRDHATGSYGYVYPVLISPAWAVFRSVPDAYAAAKGINSLVMSLAAVPAYFLARRVLGPWLSLAAAAFAVAIPSMVYTATLMTENAFYPVFLTAVLGFVVWLERPTSARTAALVALCLIAYLTRAQAVALLPAILTAPLLLVGREAFRRYRLMYAFVAVGALVVVAEQAARGRSVFGIFGAYQVASTSHYSVGEVTRWFLGPRRVCSLFGCCAPSRATITSPLWNSDAAGDWDAIPTTRRGEPGVRIVWASLRWVARRSRPTQGRSSVSTAKWPGRRRANCEVVRTDGA